MDGLKILLIHFNIINRYIQTSPENRNLGLVTYIKNLKEAYIIGGIFVTLEFVKGFSTQSLLLKGNWSNYKCIEPLKVALNEIYFLLRFLSAPYNFGSSCSRSRSCTYVLRT